MDLVKRRLNDLWTRQAAPDPGQIRGQPPYSMVVTFKNPVNISGTLLSPGRYVFRLLDDRAKPGRGTNRNRVEFFNKDRKGPVAELAPALEN